MRDGRDVFRCEKKQPTKWTFPRQEPHLGSSGFSRRGIRFSPYRFTAIPVLELLAVGERKEIMPQIFRRRTNGIARASIGFAVLIVVLSGSGVWAVWWSPYMTRQNVALDQPVPFSHEHHNAGLGIDCRYCHTTVETESMAGLPYLGRRAVSAADDV